MVCLLIEQNNLFLCHFAKVKALENLVKLGFHKLGEARTRASFVRSWREKISPENHLYLRESGESASALAVHTCDGFQSNKRGLSGGSLELTESFNTSGESAANCIRDHSLEKLVHNCL